MTSARQRMAADRAVSERVLSIAARASAATQGPWDICGPAGVMGGLVADGLDHDRARWLCQIVEDAASALDSETLGRKDGEGERHWDVGWAAGCERSVGGPAQPCGRKGVVASLS